MIMATIIVAGLFGNKSFAGNSYTVQSTEGKGVFAVITLDNGKQAFCVQRKVSHPVVGVQYSTVEYSLENLEKLFVAIHLLNDGTYDFKAAAQIATWAYIENSDFTNWVKLYVGTDAALTHYNKILEVANQVDATQYNVYIEYVAAEGYQILAIPNVAMVEPTMTLELEDEDPYPLPVPTPEPTPEVQPEKVETKVEVEEPTPAPKQEVVVQESAPKVEEIVEEEILAETYEVPTAPQTGDDTNMNTVIFSVAGILVCMGVAIIIMTKNKKA